MKKDLLIFDLDGTLIDSSDDIAWSANRTLEYMGYRERPLESIKEHIGWGVKNLLEKLMPQESNERIEEARRKFLEYYGGHLIVATRLYPGVMDTLRYFRDRKKHMAVVTNKPEALTHGIIEGLGLERFFDVVVGGDTVGNKKPHPEPVIKVLDRLGIPPDRAVFVGDSPVDCQSACAAGVDVVGVAYGFRGREELEGAGCGIIIDTFPELKGMIE